PGRREQQVRLALLRREQPEEAKDVLVAGDRGGERLVRRGAAAGVAREAQVTRRKLVIVGHAAHRRPGPGAPGRGRAGGQRPCSPNQPASLPARLTARRRRSVWSRTAVAATMSRR